jgi:TRAP-type C4-dicarboxylate transport system substrate-binding protein
MSEVRGLLGCLAVAAALASGLVTQALAADAAHLRIATVAPAGSSFHKRLQALSADWSRGPGGVAMNIYAGTQGGEPQIVRRMRVGQLQGAMLTSVGLSLIDRSVTALQYMPLVFHDWEDVDVVRERLRPQLEEKLRKAGYVVLFWGDGGWVRYFTNKPVRRLDDLKSMRIYAASGDAESVEIFKSYYTPVVLEPDQILLGLRNGMIDGLPIPAILANFSQVPTYAPYMLDLRWAPITGALVVTERAWKQLDPKAQAWLKESSERAGVEMRRASRLEDEQTIQAMKDKQGLKVTPLTPEDEREWRAEIARMYPRVRGAIVPAEMFDATVETLKARHPPGT